LSTVLAAAALSEVRAFWGLLYLACNRVTACNGLPLGSSMEHVLTQTGHDQAATTSGTLDFRCPSSRGEESPQAIKHMRV
jgi:hypothetical protein